MLTCKLKILVKETATAEQKYTEKTSYEIQLCCCSALAIRLPICLSTILILLISAAN